MKGNHGKYNSQYTIRIVLYIGNLDIVIISFALKI
jgi:hypothetical protein